MGSSAHLYKFNVTNQSTTTDNTCLSGTVNGRISLINSKVYAADSVGKLCVLDPSTFSSTPSWSYTTATAHPITSSLYVDYLLNRVYYGDTDGKLYASYNSSGTIGAQLTNFPYTSPAGVSFGTAVFYNSGVLVAGNTTGTLYIIDVNGGSGPVLKQTYRFGTANSISGIAYEQGTTSYYIVSTSNSTNKDGKLFYIADYPDPTPLSN